MSRIEELKALMEKATKRTLSYDGCSISDFDTENCMTMEWISNGYEEDEDNGDRERKDADGALFAAAVNALPDLLAVCEAAERVKHYGPLCDCEDPICKDERQLYDDLRAALAEKGTR